MTAKKTKRQTPQAVLDLIARQELELENVRRQRDEYIAMNNKNADAVNHWKHQCHDRAKEVEEYKAQTTEHAAANVELRMKIVNLEKALSDAEFRRDCASKDYNNRIVDLNAKLRETEQQVGKLFADAKRARDEQRRDRVYVLTWQALGEAPCVTGVFATLEHGKNHINGYHGVEAKWLDGARAQLMRNGACVGQYILSLRNVLPQP